MSISSFATILPSLAMGGQLAMSPAEVPESPELQVPDTVAVPDPPAEDPVEPALSTDTTTEDSAVVTAPAEAAPVTVAPALPPPSDDLVLDIVTPPPSVIDLPPPRREGTGLLVAAGILGGGTLIFRSLVTAAAVSAANNPGPYSCFGCAIVLGGGIAAPFFAVSLGLLGGGMGLRGQFRAHDDLFGGQNLPTKRIPLRPKLGWGLIGGGAGLWVVTRLGGWLGCGNEACAVAILEVGSYGALGMITAGMMLGPYGAAHGRYTRQYRSVAPRVSMQPVVSRTFAGLSLRGRF